MKKIVIAITAFILLAMIGIVIFIATYEADKFTMEEYSDCSIAYWKDGKEATAKISDEDGKVIYEILKEQEMYSENFACGFSDEYAIRFNNETVIIQLAQDACGHFYSVKDKQYIALDSGSRNTIYEILKKYGVKVIQA